MAEKDQNGKFIVIYHILCHGGRLLSSVLLFIF